MADPITSDFDCPTKLTMAKSVIHQYHEQLAQPVTVYEPVDSRFGLNIEVAAATGCQSPETRTGRDDELADVCGLQAKNGMTDIDPRQGQEIVDQPGHSLGLGWHRIEQLGVASNRLVWM